MASLCILSDSPMNECSIHNIEQGPSAVAHFQALTLELVGFFFIAGRSFDGAIITLRVWLV